jgi:hypothetical protein
VSNFKEICRQGDELAATIKPILAEREKYRAALQEIVDLSNLAPDINKWFEARAIARKALGVE